MTEMFTSITEKGRKKVVHPSDSLEPPESMAQQEECFVNQSSPEDPQSSGGSLQNGSSSKVFQVDGLPQTILFGNETLQDPQKCSPTTGGSLQDLSSPEDPQSSGESRQNGSPAKGFQINHGLTQESFFGNVFLLTTPVKLLLAVLYWVYQILILFLPGRHAFRKKTSSAISCKFSMNCVLFLSILSCVFGTGAGETCLDCIDLADPIDCYRRNANDCSEYQFLNLSSSNRSDLPSDLSVGFSNVHELHLANNNFVQIPDRAIRGFTKLNLVDFEGNNISSFNESYASLRTLTVLSLMQNIITKLPNYFNRMFPNLKTAYFGNNMITEVPYLDLDLDLDLNHSNFSILGLENNPLEKLNLEQFNRPDTVSTITATNNDILVYVNGRSSPLQIIIQGSNLICEENIYEFHQSIDVNGTISCKYRNGSKGEISLLHVTKTDPVVTTSVPTTPSVPNQNNLNVAVILSVVLVVLVVVALVIAVLVIYYLKFRKQQASSEPGSTDFTSVSDQTSEQILKLKESSDSKCTRW
ncbi:uncharacterized protein [Apostichopus japonicus]|uniref:uncharacterized protein isoform X2 n=1 Tax=Stichopus japonicus TaxID=307972 RepID=UPI003AB5C1E7